MVKRHLFWILIVLLFAQLSACSGIPKRHWPAIEGQVLDKDTGRPIEGALVFALWKGVGAYTTSMCFHVETVSTDVSGNFHIPAWRNPDSTAHLNQQHIELVAYKAGYNYWGGSDSYAQYLKKFEGTSSERISVLRDYVTLTSCYIKDIASKQSLYIKDKALYEEAEKVATTIEDKYDLIDFLYGVERHELGSALANKRALQRFRESEYEPPECSSTKSIRNGCRYKVPEE